MPAITLKFQKCGKIGCRCREGRPHGPYFWLIIYKKTGQRRGQYQWTYLGKDGKSIEARLGKEDFALQWDQSKWNDFRKRLRRLLREKKGTRADES